MSAYELNIIRDRISVLEQKVDDMSGTLHNILHRLQQLETVRVAHLENTMPAEYERITRDMFDSLRSMARSATDALKADVLTEMRQVAQQAVTLHERDRHP